MIKSGTVYILFLVLAIFTGCKSSIKQQEDKIYSRHLQRHVSLEIISAGMPDEKASMNLVLSNQNNDLLRNLNCKQIIDSLYSNEKINPVLLVMVNGTKEEYQVSFTDKKSKGEKFNMFVINELLPYIKKKTAVRKFKSVTYLGCEDAGASALYISWNHADKIDKAGAMFGNVTGSGTGENAILEIIRQSRKRPALSFWFYTTGTDTVAVTNTKALIEVISKKNISPKADIKYVTGEKVDSNSFATFLLWAIGK